MSVRSLFLPEGYPNSTSEDYLAFQLYDSVQGLSSYCRGVLVTQALMIGIGVGIMKDLIGMLGGMLFSLLQGSHFDADAKQWRFFADIANNVGLGLELAAPLFPGYFLAVICAGSMCRALTGVAAGATRASLTSHFAREANAADIAAKEASQETCVTLLGMCVGLALGRLVEAAPYCVWPVFLALTALHVVANAKAVRSLRITSLNRERTRLLLQHYQRTGEALRPHELAPLESLLPGQQRLREWIRMLVGRSDAPASIVLGGKLSSDALATGVDHAYEDYLMYMTPCGKIWAITVVLRRHLPQRMLFKSYVHALVLATSLQRALKPRQAAAVSDRWMGVMQVHGHDENDSHFRRFEAALEKAGWDLSRIVLCPGEWRHEWEGLNGGRT